MKTLTAILICLSFLFAGCADRGQYYQAIKEQNVTMQLYSSQQERARLDRIADAEKRREAHQERMAALMGNMISAVSKTKDTTDDVMAPILFMMMEDKWALGEMIVSSTRKEVNTTPTLQTISAPADGVDYLKASLPIVGGTIAAVLGWKSYETIADVAAQAGGRYYLSDNATMHQNSDNTGSYNNQSTGGDAAINAHTGDNNPEEREDVEMCTGARGSVPYFDGDMVSVTCSCSSYQESACDI